MKNLVVGAGLTGAVIAERLASKLGESVTVIEKESHLGGIYYDYFDGETSNLVHANHYNVLHTNIKYVWDYLNQFGEMKPFYFRPKAEIQGRPVSIPLCLTSLYEIFPNDFAKSFESKLISKYGYNNRITISDIHKNYDEDLKFLAEYFYENLFKPYTIKRWGVKEENIPPCSETLYPFFTGIDTRYYKDKYQAVPEDGWTKLIENMLKHKNIKLKLNTNFSDINADKYDRIFYTGSIDEFFDYKYGELQYRSVNIRTKNVLIDNTKPYHSYNTPVNFDFIRVNNYKYFTDNNENEKCTIGYEFIEDFKLGQNERIYPVHNNISNEIYNKYYQESLKYPNIKFIGRLGKFEYYETDMLVAEAINAVASLVVISENDDNNENRLGLENE